jgi:ABC-type transporter Mla MlaB component
VGLFSFLKKKSDPPEAAVPARARAHDTGRPGAGPTTRMPLDTEAERERQREIARATAAKIDEIELEMASDIFDDEAWGSNRRAPAAASGAASAPLVDLNTDGLLGLEDMPDTVAVAANAPAVEEAAILYANGQRDAAEHLLRACLAETGRSERLPWWMLFDLYQAEAREQDFESIAIDYASHFETSPPAYKPLAMTQSGQRFVGVTPTAHLSGTLDGGAGAQLARVLDASASPVVRLEFSAVARATPEGCQVLLAALQTLRRAGRELVLAGPAQGLQVLAGADHLVALLRPMLAIGERNASEAPWLLLLELLLLMNHEKDFEETAMDYCITFEVSPPSFEAPARTALSVGAAAPAEGGPESDRFLLPGVVEGDSAALLASIAAHATRHETLVLDGWRLARIDYGAANALAAQLRALAAGERAIELRDLNHLVAALLRLLGVGEVARLYAHKY